MTGLLPGGRVVHGAANLGIRPTFDPPKELLEPYFFDFDGDLYGQEIEVGFHHFLRGEAKFDSLEALTAQMEQDCAEAKLRLAAVPVDYFAQRRGERREEGRCSREGAKMLSMRRRPLLSIATFAGRQVCK